jgi:colanic acid biosynthesis glycosyl transferase WcaI
MRILLLNTSFPPQARSAARLFCELGTSLVRRGHQVSVVTEHPWRRLGSGAVSSAIPVYERMNGMEVYRVRAARFGENSILGRGINLLLVPWRFYHAAKRTARHDVVLVYSPPLTLGLVAWKLKREFGTPFIFNVQDIYPQTAIDLGYLRNSLLIRALEALEEFIYLQADRVVVHSAGNRSYLVSRGRVREEKIVDIPNWVDTGRVLPTTRFNSFRDRYQIGEKFLVSYAGTMGYAQDLSPIIAAAQKLRDLEDILFLLVGEGVRAEEWREKTKDLPNVRFLPLLSQAEYGSLVNACDIGFVSLAENLRTPVVPAKLLDFMAAARPVIATVNPASDSAAIITTAKCGFAFCPRDSAGVADAILFLRDNLGLTQAMGNNGRRYAEEKLSLLKCSARYEDLFREVLQGTGTVPTASDEVSSASLQSNGY